MEANNWEDVKFLKDTAGIPIEKALGLEDDDGDMPSLETFKENLIVRGFGDKPLKFKLPDPKDIPLIGVPDPKDLDQTYVFPPFIDLDSLLDPVFIPASKITMGNEQQTASTLSPGAPDSVKKENVESPNRDPTEEQLPIECCEASTDNDETPPISDLDMPEAEIKQQVHQESFNQDAEQVGSEPMEQSMLTDDDSLIEMTASQPVSTPELIPSSNSGTSSSNVSIIDLTQDF